MLKQFVADFLSIHRGFVGNLSQICCQFIGSSIDRVSGRRELLPSASEQILSPLRFQETRGGSGVRHFGFKAHPPALVFFSLQVAFLGLRTSFVCPASIVHRRPLWYAGPLVRVDVRSGLVD